MRKYYKLFWTEVENASSKNPVESLTKKIHII